MASQLIQGEVVVVGSLAVQGSFSGSIARTSLVQDLTQTYDLPVPLWRVWDGNYGPLTSAGADDIGVTTGAFGTGCPYLHGGDMNAAGAITRYARTTIMLPPEYVNGAAITLRAAAGMLTSVASVSATVDFEAYLSGRNALISGSDLVTTTAQSINSLTFATYSFTVTPTSRVPGDLLDIRVTIAANSVTASSHFAVIAGAELALTIKG